MKKPDWAERTALKYSSYPDMSVDFNEVVALLRAQRARSRRVVRRLWRNSYKTITLHDILEALR